MNFQTENKPLDKYELKLEIKLKELQECQVLNNLVSCVPCNSFFACILRKEYVNTVYDSMSKGSSGGFEF